MVEVSIEGSELVLEVKGMDKVWSLHSKLRIPLEHVTSVVVNNEAALGWLKGIKLGGTFLPGVITAGTFYQKGGLVFWDVHHGADAVEIETTHEHYKKLVVEVADPLSTVNMINSYLKNRA